MHTTNRLSCPAASREGHPRPIVSDRPATQEPRGQHIKRLMRPGASKGVRWCPRIRQLAPMATLLATSTGPKDVPRRWELQRMHARQVAVTRAQLTHRARTAGAPPSMPPPRARSVSRQAIGYGCCYRTGSMRRRSWAPSGSAGSTAWPAAHGCWFDTATATDLLGGDGYAEIDVDAQGRHRGDAPPAGRRRGRQGRDGAGCDAGRAA